MSLPISALARAALFARCPRCERGPIFDRFLTLRSHCPHCSYDYSHADQGDGPAVFLIFIVGFLFLPIVMISEVGADRPIWLSLAIWGPIILLLVILLLRPAKALTIALAYHTKRDREGVIE
jgi:uncharacterized protein (DUF983 family)